MIAAGAYSWRPSARDARCNCLTNCTGVCMCLQTSCWDWQHDSKDRSTSNTSSFQSTSKSRTPSWSSKRTRSPSLTRFNLSSRLVMPRADRREGGNKRCFCPSVCPSVAYIANNSIIGRMVPHLRCDSNTSFKVKRSKVSVGGGRGHTVSAEPRGHTACIRCIVVFTYFRASVYSECYVGTLRYWDHFSVCLSVCLWSAWVASKQRTFYRICLRHLLDHASSSIVKKPRKCLQPFFQSRTTYIHGL